MTGSTLAYGLRAEHEHDGAEPFIGGVIRVGDRDLDIADALERDGRIVIAVDDHTAAIALDAYTPLKRVASSDDDALTITRWDGTLYDELRAELRRRGLSAGGKRDELVDRLVANDAELATGSIAAQPMPAADPPVEPNPATPPPSPTPPTPPPSPTAPTDNPPEA